MFHFMRALFSGHWHYFSVDLTRFLNGYFDTTTGPKDEAASYTAIAKEFRLQPSEIVFVSDVTRELDAASAAGLSAVLSVRPGNAAQCEHSFSFGHEPVGYPDLMDADASNTLVLMAGLPGTGKSTLACALPFLRERSREIVSASGARLRIIRCVAPKEMRMTRLSTRSRQLSQWSADFAWDNDQEIWYAHLPDESLVVQGDKPFAGSAGQPTSGRENTACHSANSSGRSCATSSRGYRNG
jgi:hypothetical protein